MGQVMSNLPLQPLVWARIDTDKTSGIYCGKTDSYIYDAVSFCSTPVADYVIRKDDKTGKYRTNYGGRTENPYDTINEAEHWAEFTHYASQMQQYVKPDSITDISNWFKAAKPEPTDKDRLTQIGCHYEEVDEMTVALTTKNSGMDKYSSKELSDNFKGATFGNTDIQEVYFSTVIDRIELLDALCDQIVTATGVAYMMGFDIEGALKEVIRSNNSKFENGKPIFNEQGKIMKGKDYSKPDLTPFIK